MLRIKELNLTCMINDSERITEKLGHSIYLYLIKLEMLDVVMNISPGDNTRW